MCAVLLLSFLWSSYSLWSSHRWQGISHAGTRAQIHRHTAPPLQAWGFSKHSLDYAQYSMEIARKQTWSCSKLIGILAWTCLKDKDIIKKEKKERENHQIIKNCQAILVSGPIQFKVELEDSKPGRFIDF